MRFTANKKGKIGFTVRMDDAHTGGQRTVTGNSITISGKLTLLSYKAQLTVLNEGGTLQAGDSTLTLTGADAATLLLSAGTDYDPQSPDYLTRSDWKGKVSHRCGPCRFQRIRRVAESALGRLSCTV
ncbi:MAG: glycoside hydrolase N-terminal domain-containing protein [Alistipes indistinctus]